MREFFARLVLLTKRILMIRLVSKLKLKPPINLGALFMVLCYDPLSEIYLTTLLR